MERFIIDKWESHKNKLRSFIECLSVDAIRNLCYEDMIRMYIDKILNDQYDTFNIVVLERNGNYDGDVITVIKRKNPDWIDDYFCICVSYGTCSYCDALYKITEDVDDEVTKETIDKLMTLFLHLVQQTKCIGNLYKED